MENMSELLEKIDASEPIKVMEKAISYYGERITMATSLQLGGLVLIDMLHQIGTEIRVFSIDTGRLPEDTFECAENVYRKYGIRIEWVFPSFEDVQQIESNKGLYSFKESVENRKECCYIRKVKPLKRALEGFDAWITGRRLDQGQTRTDLNRVEVDPVHSGKIKINPLISWNKGDLWDYVHKHKVPYNSLYDKGYLSIGCGPCTRPCANGEDERAGRWWWELPEHKECGIHFTFQDGSGI